MCVVYDVVELYLYIGVIFVGVSILAGVLDYREAWWGSYMGFLPWGQVCILPNSCLDECVS